MELNEEDLELELTNVFETTNPKLIIRNYFSNIRQEIDAYSDKYLNEKLKSTNEDRIELTFKRDKMLQQLDSIEKQCFNSKSDRQLVKVSTSLNFLLDKLNKISNGYLNKIDLNDKSLESDSSSNESSQIKNELYDLKRDLFLNRTCLFVRNLSNMKTNQFGNLVILDFYLDDFEVKALK